MTSLNTVHDTHLYTQRHSVHESCIPDSTNITSTVYIITASRVSPVISYLVVLDKIGPYRITRSAYNTSRTY